MPIDPLLWAEGPISSSIPRLHGGQSGGRAGDGGAAATCARCARGCCASGASSTRPSPSSRRRGGRVWTWSASGSTWLARDRRGVRGGPGADPVWARGAPEGEDRLPFPGCGVRSRTRLSAYDVSPYEEGGRCGRCGGATVAVSAGCARRDHALRPPGDGGGRGGVRAAGHDAPAELWRLAAEWQVKPVRVLTGELWELADRAVNPDDHARCFALLVRDLEVVRILDHLQEQPCAPARRPA